MCRERDSNPHGHSWPRDFKSLVSTNSTIAASSGAENGTRTRDPNLGKVVLYQLSYFRKISEEEETRTPTSQLTLPPQSSASTNSATSPTLFYLQEPSAFKLLCGKKNIVPRTGLEPARLSTHAPETCASTNSATWAFLRLIAFNVSCLSNK